MNKIPEPVIESIRAQQEVGLLEFIEQSLNLRTIYTLLQYKVQEQGDDPWSYLLKGYSLPMYEGFGGRIYDICRRTAAKLGLAESAVEFYVSNDPEHNAFSMAPMFEGKPARIAVNQGLLEKTPLEELPFIIGHEIGHLIFLHCRPTLALQLIYDNPEESPPTLQRLFGVWQSLGEISCDRVGLLALDDIETATRALFRLSSGLEDRYFNLSHEGLLKIVDRTYAELEQAGSAVLSSHPANPIRIRALLAFHGSQSWQSARAGNPAPADPALDEQMDNVVAMVSRAHLSPQQEAEVVFLAAAGTRLIMTDDSEAPEEVALLDNLLACHVYWPRELVAQLREGGIDKALVESAGFIRENFPQSRAPLLAALADIIMRDRRVDDREVEEYLRISQEVLLVQPSEAIDIFLGRVAASYRPLS